ncbi:MAG: hypothetical protein ACK4TL_15620 [Hyphomicrobiaceae bacterium]
MNSDPARSSAPRSPTSSDGITVVSLSAKLPLEQFADELSRCAWRMSSDHVARISPAAFGAVRLSSRGRVTSASMMMPWIEAFQTDRDGEHTVDRAVSSLCMALLHGTPS